MCFGRGASLHPDAQPASAAVSACRLLRKANVRAELWRVRADRLKRLEMGGDEAVALIAIAARADIGDAYAPDGTLLPVAQWPEALRLAVKSIPRPVREEHHPPRCAPGTRADRRDER